MKRFARLTLTAVVASSAFACTPTTYQQEMQAAADEKIVHMADWLACLKENGRDSSRTACADQEWQMNDANANFDRYMKSYLKYTQASKSEKIKVTGRWRNYLTAKEDSLHTVYKVF